MEREKDPALEDLEKESQSITRRTVAAASALVAALQVTAGIALDRGTRQEQDDAIDAKLYSSDNNDDDDENDVSDDDSASSGDEDDAEQKKSSHNAEVRGISNGDNDEDEDEDDGEVESITDAPPSGNLKEEDLANEQAEDDHHSDDDDEGEEEEDDDEDEDEEDEDEDEEDEDEDEEEEEDALSELEDLHPMDLEHDAHLAVIADARSDAETVDGDDGNGNGDEDDYEVELEDEANRGTQGMLKRLQSLRKSTINDSRVSSSSVWTSFRRTITRVFDMEPARVPLVEEPLSDATKLDVDSFTTSSGADLFVYEWRSNYARPRGIIWAIHDLGSHVMFDFLRHMKFPRPNSYEGGYSVIPAYAGSWVETMNEDGFLVIAVDLQAHGRSSDGPSETRFCVKNIMTHVEDLIEFHEYMRSLYVGVPTAILANGLGATLACRVMQLEKERGIEPVDACVLVSPMLSTSALGGSKNRISSTLTRLMASTMPSWRGIERPQHIEQAMRNAWNADRLTDKGLIRSRVALDIVAVIDAVNKSATAIDVPILSVQSLTDEISEITSTETFHEKLSNTQSALFVLNERGLWHELIQEPNNAKVLADVRAWLNMHQNLKLISKLG
ncbi:Monoglyceride lipase, putative [Hondaea fermentalgiana]|uniref:Monoglyceride lipase, putative n=1 Tax=Hondaea fermentalgiana TaxID=2315210 RepID=A0A2R5G8S9_9STRA|nr:Monoglyceride lipase, putative [Hondaea fermentalgiana]|eukprot:GBG24461.1 Monoglyceride lipase, putative [Hondaea fermentalgiana]